MPVRLKAAEDDYLPEVDRRFLFDDVAVQEQQANKASGAAGMAMAAKELFKTDQAPLEDIADVVDRDHRALESEAMHKLVAKMLPSPVFRGFILLLIVANAIIIGIQTDERLGREYGYLFSLLDQFVLTVFVAEIALKWYYGFIIFWKVGWNILDFIIVAALLLGPAFQYLGSSRILRILRVLRAARSLRSISGLQGLSLVVQTVLQSLPDMFNIALVLCIILIVFAVAGITLFGKDLPEYFGSLGTAMFSLFICVTQDGWLDILDAFKSAGETQPWINIVGMVYLVLAITVGAFVFANLAVAAVVTNLEIAMKEIKAESKTDDSLNYVDAEEVTHIPVLTADEVTKTFDFSSQAPVHAPDLRNLSITKLENYFMLLTALEENLAEYKAIRDDLDKIFDVVCELNVQDKPNSGSNPPSDNSKQAGGGGIAGGTAIVSKTSLLGKEASFSGLPLSDLKKMKGDILSNMMMLNESQQHAHLGSTMTPPQNFNDVIKNTAKQLT